MTDTLVGRKFEQETGGKIAIFTVLRPHATEPDTFWCSVRGAYGTMKQRPRSRAVIEKALSAKKD